MKYVDLGDVERDCESDTEGRGNTNGSIAECAPETRSERLISRFDQVFSKPARIECKFCSISLQVVSRKKIPF